MGDMPYQTLLVWRESFRLTKEIYKLTEQFTSRERFEIVSQMRRAAVSIPSNIAEGYRRRHAKEILHYCQIAFGSASELEVQLMLSKDLGLANKDNFIESERALQSTLKLLNLFCKSLTRQIPK